jgi:peptidoglycan/LPS O-acetylase OafA/YrhL
VIVFFVISGFVIAMTAENRTLFEFAIDRTVRIYIVAAPILVITTVLATMFPEASDHFRPATEQPIPTNFLSVTFLCQSWWLATQPRMF